MAPGDPATRLQPTRWIPVRGEPRLSQPSDACLLRWASDEFRFLVPAAINGRLIKLTSHAVAEDLARRETRDELATVPQLKLRETPCQSWTDLPVAQVLRPLCL